MTIASASPTESRGVRTKSVRHCLLSRLSEYAGASAGRVARRRSKGRPARRSKVTPVCQAVLAIQWLWSLSRLCVAVTNRHSDCAAALPLRMNRSMCRLCLICP